MNDTFTTVTRRNYFQRLGDSLVGVLIGFVLLLAAPVMLFWNEGRAVNASMGLNAAVRAAVSVPDAQPKPDNEGKLVHVTANASTATTLQDSELGVPVSGALALVRTVEMFQWVESSSTETKEKVGGTAETTTTTSYAKAWSAEPVDSSTFKRPEGHANPAMPLTSQSFLAGDATLGGYRLTADVLGMLPVDVPFVPDAAPAGWTRSTDGLFRGIGSPAAPALGDLRVTYAMVPAGPMSVMGAQQSGTLVAWSAPRGSYEVLLASTGTLTADAMVDGAKDAENVLSWVLRGLGAILCMAAIGLLVGPLRALANVLPFAAGIIGSITGFAAMLIGGALAMIVIAIAWFAVRPILSLVLLALAVAAIVAVRQTRPKAAETQAAA